MGKKYIIELLDDCNSEFKGIMAFGLTQEKQISVELIPEESLRPYTEPEPHAEVTADAYQRGYEQGLSDAWEAERKVVALSTVDRRKVFGSEYMYSILEKHTASEAIEKLKAYEQEQNEIQVGDEVITDSGKAVVMGVGPVHFEYVYADGSSGYDEVKNVKKTGRHFPEIVSVLQKMKEA